MSLRPEELEQRANQILGEKPVGLQEDQPGIVSLEGNPATAARTAFH